MAKIKTRQIFAVLAGLFLVYAALGFFIVPLVARDQLLKAVQKQYGVTSTVEKIYFNPFTFEAEMTKFVIPADPTSELTANRLEIGQLSANLQIGPLLEKRIYLKQFYIDKTELDFMVFKNGRTNWTPIKTEEPAAINVEEKNSKPWTLTLERLQIENTKMVFLDQTHREPLNLPVGPINLTALNISTSLGSQTSLENLNILFGPSGSLQVSGQLSLEPLTADIQFKISRLPLEFITSYLSDKTRLAVNNGELNIGGRASYRDSQARLNADAEITNFELIQQKSQKSVMSWKTLDLKNIAMQTAAMQIRINEAVLSGLDTSLVLRKDGRLSYKDYLREKAEVAPTTKSQSSTSEKPGAPSKPEKPLDFEVTHFKIEKGQFNYSDQQIKPNFSAHINNLEGVIEPLTFNTGKKIEVRLSGRVEAQGKFQAKGFVIPNPQRPNLDLNVEFNNIELTTFTPYAGKFAGYEISKGKMFLKLNYSLRNRFIRGKNNAILDQFTLGKQVDSDEATNLPLKLALALMKDREGKIVINLPVEGDVSSAQFSFGGLIWTALKNAIINVAAAPFDFLKSVLGGGDSLDMVYFEPGKSAIVVAEQMKLQQISKVLNERPQLVIEVQGRTQLADIEALKKLKQKSGITAEELKTLGEQRGKLIQNSLATLQVDPARIYLVATEHIEKNDMQPHTILYLKSRD